KLCFVCRHTVAVPEIALHFDACHGCSSWQTNTREAGMFQNANIGVRRYYLPRSATLAHRSL
ncbi:hypothetical protein, partial [Mesorhizobium humile]|uniref:hypothetical protein n=1 Tax=Mesorhizobium humile TaxID=3072313 RepID=UPI002A23CE7A